LKLPAEIQVVMKHLATDCLLEKLVHAGFDNDKISEWDRHQVMGTYAEIMWAQTEKAQKEVKAAEAGVDVSEDTIAVTITKPKSVGT
jgi:hypothetical protein